MTHIWRGAIKANNTNLMKANNTNLMTNLVRWRTLCASDYSASDDPTDLFGGGFAMTDPQADFRQNVGVSLTVTPCWCYGSETMDMDPLLPKAVWGFNGTERPGAVYLAAVLAGHAQKGLPAFGIYGRDVQAAGDPNIPVDVKDKLLGFVRCGLAVALMRGKAYLSMGGTSMGIAGSMVDYSFWEKYLGMRVEDIDMTEFVGCMGPSQRQSPLFERHSPDGLIGEHHELPREIPILRCAANLCLNERPLSFKPAIFFLLVTVKLTIVAGADVHVMKTYFPLVQKPIAYEGSKSRNPLSFKWFNPAQKVRGKTMTKHFRFAVAYWHTLKGGGSDMFGPAAWVREWNAGSPMEVAEHTLRANFEFCQKLGVPYYCFHDRDIAPEVETFGESAKNHEIMVKEVAKMQRETGIKLLWGTANLFCNPRYTHGAGTNPDLKVFAYAAAQLKHALEATAELGGSGQQHGSVYLKREAAAENKSGSNNTTASGLFFRWDTDQFPLNLYDTTTAMMAVLGQKGGLGTGGFNFDAKCRRGSNDVMDLFYAHIGGMDAFAKGLTHLTHFGNAMTPFHHREIGVVGSGLLDDELMIELICDTIHLCPDMLREVLRMVSRVLVSSTEEKCCEHPKPGDYIDHQSGTAWRFCRAPPIPCRSEETFFPHATEREIPEIDSRGNKNRKEIIDTPRID